VAALHGDGEAQPQHALLAEAHGGTLVLERSGAGGTTFCLSLPVGSDLDFLAREARLEKIEI